MAKINSSTSSGEHNSFNYKRVYLLIYNIVMFVMFLAVTLSLSRKTLAGSMDENSLLGITLIVRLLTYAQLLEVIHPMLGLVPGGPFMPFMQTLGRMVVNYFLIDPNIWKDSAPFVVYLFIVWSSIEIFRYSFYALRLFKFDIYAITWARYSLFLPLYPMGGFCESQVVLTAAKQFERTGAYSVGLPNVTNASFYSPGVLRFYAYVMLGPGILFLMNYMWNQRCKQLKAKRD